MQPLSARPEVDTWYEARRLSDPLADAGRLDEAIAVLQPTYGAGRSQTAGRASSAKDAPRRPSSSCTNVRPAFRLTTLRLRQADTRRHAGRSVVGVSETRCSISLGFRAGTVWPNSFASESIPRPATVGLSGTSVRNAQGSQGTRSPNPAGCPTIPPRLTLIHEFSRIRDVHCGTTPAAHFPLPEYVRPCGSSVVWAPVTVPSASSGSVVRSTENAWTRIRRWERQRAARPRTSQPMVRAADSYWAACFGVR